MTPSRAPQFDLAAGTMLGKYEIVRKLAMGGMAEIYLARLRGNAGFEKLVVIKRILPTVANDPKFVEMFLDEARLAATLQHPNIADVHEVGEHEGSPFFAMEFIHGQDVRGIRHGARKRKENVPLAIALAIVHGTAAALDYAHDKCGPDGKNLGLVHRDVSSSNILVSYEGAIKLIDFGIARATSRTLRTQTGTLKGKIPYMSPEQCKGHPMDRRSDLFSLGVVMYELTTGRRPFRGESDFAIMDQIVHRGTPRPSAEIRDYPPELEAIVLKLLAPDLAERYQSGEQLIHDLEPFIAQHRLWTSAKPLSRYMRALFGEAAAGTSIEAIAKGAMIPEVSTGQSQSLELMTPPSAFPGIMSLSREMPALKVATAPTMRQPVAVADEGNDFDNDLPTVAAMPSTSDLLASGAPAAARAPATPVAVEPAAVEPAFDVSYPSLRRSYRGFVIAAVLLLGIGGGYAWYATRTTDSAAATRDDQPPLTHATVTTDKPVDTKPVDTKPVDTTPTVDTKPSADTRPTIAIEPVVDKKPKQVSTKVVVKQQPAKPTKDPKTPTKDPKTPTKDPKDKDQKDPKDPAWNLDSPFLPH